MYIYFVEKLRFEEDEIRSDIANNMRSISFLVIERFILNIQKN